MRAAASVVWAIVLVSGGAPALAVDPATLSRLGQSVAEWGTLKEDRDESDGRSAEVSGRGDAATGDTVATAEGQPHTRAGVSAFDGELTQERVKQQRYVASVEQTASTFTSVAIGSSPLAPYAPVKTLVDAVQSGRAVIGVSRAETMGQFETAGQALPGWAVPARLTAPALKDYVAATQGPASSPLVAGSPALAVAPSSGLSTAALRTAPTVRVDPALGAYLGTLTGSSPRAVSATAVPSVAVSPQLLTGGPAPTVDRGLVQTLSQHATPIRPNPATLPRMWVPGAAPTTRLPQVTVPGGVATQPIRTNTVPAAVEPRRRY
jgi:hypothetical protein